MKIFKVRIAFRRILAKMVAVLIEAGESMNAIQKRAGHASAKTTSDIYGHVTNKLEFNTLIILILKILRNNLADKVRPQPKEIEQTFVVKKQKTLAKQGFQR
ncbi:hypothetical protein ABE33_10390 [Bacillus safensis]|uniref:hypothetical protein n=1 Tax=Bacillus TaxID=1386 RepID=UPI001D216B33|nr:MULTISPECIES: hypothetical protein [Bacillus]MBG9826041.1 hypothetical protein [Bacillus safensis]MBG9835686.1 hypothetical protein [Bacillus safensis]MBG9861431.1 hypothetical protein [Bacillus safensis]MBG9900626.1 hypothetical protein [Bacillus safensis]WNF52018.1 hypothetical protein RHP70_06380 [Bacillus sp. SG20001]